MGVLAACLLGLIAAAPVATSIAAALAASAADPTWDCQRPGTCAFCVNCNNCTEGPGGTPGGCGHCRFCSPAACPAPECVGPVVTVAQGSSDPSIAACRLAGNHNIRGEVLVLDVNSWEPSDGAQEPPRVTTARQCCQECQKFLGCNAWSFCFNPEGCGAPGECAASAATGPACTQFGPESGCTPDGKWPHLMCSLKRVADPSSPSSYWGGVTGGYWTSGVLVTADEAREVKAAARDSTPLSDLCKL